eukprot:1870229-Pleurochrysis_carterae.AAC.5
MVAAMLMAAGVVNGPADGDNPKPEVIRHAQVTPGGERFCGHAANPKAIEMLARVWDVVVLQDNSGVPGGASKNAYKASLKALQEDLAPLTTRSAHCILYSTWGHLHGSVYEKQRAAYPDYLIMQRLTTAGCEAYFHLLSELRSQNDNALRTSLAPVGDAFLIIYEEDMSQGVDDNAYELVSLCVRACVRACMLACASSFMSPFSYFTSLYVCACASAIVRVSCVRELLYPLSVLSGLLWVMDLHDCSFGCRYDHGSQPGCIL